MAKTDRGGWFRRHKILTAIGVIVVIIIIASAASGGNKSNNDSSSSNTSNSGVTKMAKIGQPADDGKFQFVVTGMQCGQPSVSSADGYLTKTAQGQYCSLNLTANNIGNQSQTLDSSSQYLYDNSNKKYSSDSEATIDISPTDNTFFNAINPGNTVTGTIVFDLPKGVTPITAELHDSAFSGGVKVNLQ